MAALRNIEALAFGVFAFAAPASAQMEPNSPDAIAGAAADCWVSTGVVAVDEAKLQQLGWKPGTMSSADGKPVATPLRFYGKPDSSVMLTILDTPGMKGCAIVSRVAKPADIGETAQLLLKRLVAIDPTVKGARQGQSVVYVSVPRAAELVPTGTMEKPATRIVVGYTSSEKK